MRWIDIDTVIPQFEMMATASKKSIDSNGSNKSVDEVTREAIKAIAGTLKAVIKVLGEQKEIDVVPVQNLAEFLSGYAVPPNYSQREAGHLVPTSHEMVEMWASWIREQCWK